MTAPAPPTPEEFAAWAARLGLGRLQPDDLDALRQGWIGLQRQLALVRGAIGPEDRPPRPPLGAGGDAGRVGGSRTGRGA